MELNNIMTNQSHSNNDVKATIARVATEVQRLSLQTRQIEIHEMRERALDKKYTSFDGEKRTLQEKVPKKPKSRSKSGSQSRGRTRPSLTEKPHSLSASTGMTATTCSASKPESSHSSSSLSLQRPRCTSPGDQQVINLHGEVPLYIPKPRRASMPSRDASIPSHVELDRLDYAAIPLEIQLPHDDDDDDDARNESSSFSNISHNENVVQVQNVEIQDAMGDEGVYTGTILQESHLPHGKKGTMIYDEYRSYSGEWVYGNWHGRGIMVNERSYTYKGNFHENQKHGHGVISYKDGRRYIGSFCEDERHGEGYLVFSDGSYYRGSFQRGLFHGKGVSKFAQGGHYNGNWKRGKYDGYGICVWPDGRVYRGEWKRGKTHGKGVEYRADGSLRHIGEFANDQPVRD